MKEQTQLPANAGISQWQLAGREAKRDLDIWSNVFAGQANRLVRVAGGWAANDWGTNEIVTSMQGSFDAIAIAPYFSPGDPQRNSYTTSTTVDTILADTWTTRLGRDIQLVAYEGGRGIESLPFALRLLHASADP